MMRLPKGFLKGSIPPLITPFKNGKVDYDAYAGLVEFQVKNGSHGILVNGTTSDVNGMRPAGFMTRGEKLTKRDVAYDARFRPRPLPPPVTNFGPFKKK